MSYGAETQTLTSWHPIKGQANVEEYLNMEKQPVNNRKSKGFRWIAPTIDTELVIYRLYTENCISTWGISRKQLPIETKMNNMNNRLIQQTGLNKSIVIMTLSTKKKILCYHSFRL